MTVSLKLNETKRRMFISNTVPVQAESSFDPSSITERWIGTVLREIDTPPKPSDEFLSEELFKPTAVLIDAREQIVANGAGMRLLTKLEKLEGELEDLRRNNLDNYDRVFEIRKVTLDDWSGQAEVHDAQLEREFRNEQVHGGAIVNDVAVISAFDGKPRAEKWKDAFEDSYGVDFYTMKRILKSVPPEIIIMLNRRASAKKLIVWKRNRAYRARKIIQYADEAISLWAQDPGTRFAAGSRGYELLDLIEYLWHYSR
ncbi:hypothetical protein V8E54_013268 [Elaphomyces granulatus]